ncbi:hypothetical protein PENSPDRAFT_692445 [Peniophora sp. CONT]|nr:hypothetical protein PENSPDRAFT_692445 [Peniophora sp. CONT]
MNSSARIHVLGLGLSYDEAYDLAIAMGITKRYLDKHEVDDALNAYFTSRGYATVCMELPAHVAESYAEQEYDYCIITNFRVVRHDPNTPYNIMDERPRADEWTQRVADVLLPGSEYGDILMRMTFDNWGSVPGLIHTFYKHQARGKPIIQADGLSPDQTDYRPILKERAKRLRQERAAGFILALHGPQGLASATKSKATTSTADPASWDEKTPKATYNRHAGGDYFTCKPVVSVTVELDVEEVEDDMKTPTASTFAASVSLEGCNSDSDEGYFSDKPVIATR